MAKLSFLTPSVNAAENLFIQANTQNRKGFVVKGETYIKLTVAGEHYYYGQENDLVVESAGDKLDTGSTLAAGKDYYIYLCHKTAESAELVVSLNSTYPSGYDASTSRKIGGFHTLCAAAKGYAAGDIIPVSIWCLTHRPTCSPEGMAYVDSLNIWVDIYLQSGTGANTRSIFGGTIADARNYMDFVDDLAAVGKTMLNDEEFQVASEGSNQRTNISGSKDPVTTGGHTDTAGTRMVSNFWLEDCCGALNQWISGGGWEYGSAGNYTANWSENWPGGKGQIYSSSGRSALLAGGHWGSGANCGSRSRMASGSRAQTTQSFGCRGRAWSI